MFSVKCTKLISPVFPVSLRIKLVLFSRCILEWGPNLKKKRTIVRLFPGRWARSIKSQRTGEGREEIAGDTEIGYPSLTTWGGQGTTLMCAEGDHHWALCDMKYRVQDHLPCRWLSPLNPGTLITVSSLPPQKKSHLITGLIHHNLFICGSVPMAPPSPSKLLSRSPSPCRKTVKCEDLEFGGATGTGSLHLKKVVNKLGRAVLSVPCRKAVVS